MATKATLEENHPSTGRCVSDWEEACLHIHLADSLVDFEKNKQWKYMEILWCYNGYDGYVGMSVWDTFPRPVWLSDSAGRKRGVTAQDSKTAVETREMISQQLSLL